MSVARSALALLLCSCASVRVAADGATVVHSMGPMSVETHVCAPLAPVQAETSPWLPAELAPPERTCVKVEPVSLVGQLVQHIAEGVLIAEIVAYLRNR